jgi:hypothetical protein
MGPLYLEQVNLQYSKAAMRQGPFEMYMRMNIVSLI